MKKKSLLVLTVAVMIVSIVLGACAPIPVSAAGNGNGGGNGNNGSENGNTGSDTGNGTNTNGQNGTNPGSGQAVQAGLGYGPGSGNTGDGAGPKSRSGNGAGQRNPGTGAGQPGGGLALGPLSEQEIQGLTEALLEEYTAHAAYQKVLDTLGDVDPFNRIVLSEAQHAAVLEGLANKYEVALPQPPSSDTFPVYATLQEACQAAVQLEIEDAALYDDLKQFTVHADLLQVYTNLQNASLNSHLPAFQACQ